MRIQNILLASLVISISAVAAESMPPSNSAPAGTTVGAPADTTQVATKHKKSAKKHHKKKHHKKKHN